MFNTKTYSSLLFALLLTSSLVACSDKPTEPRGEPSAPADQRTLSSPMAEPAIDSTPSQPSKETSAMSSTPIVNLNTNLGNIKLELDAEKAPLSVANFVQYAQEGHYDGTIFHRVIPGFMIQAGGFEPGLQKKDTRSPIMNEANNGLSNADLTIAMARTGDPHSATAQFFINVTNNDRLDFTAESPAGWGYAVFGKVVEGEEVVRQIAGVSTGQVGPYGDVPLEDIVIERVIVE